LIEKPVSGPVTYNGPNWELANKTELATPLLALDFMSFKVLI